MSAMLILPLAVAGADDGGRGAMEVARHFSIVPDKAEPARTSARLNGDDQDRRPFRPSSSPIPARKQGGKKRKAAGRCDAGEWRVVIIAPDNLHGDRQICTASSCAR